MQKLFLMALMAVFFLAGCGNHLKDQKQAVSTNTHEKELVKLKNNNKVEIHNSVFKPKAVITSTPITVQSTTASISVSQIAGNVSKILFHIWRTADGPAAMKTFSSSNAANHFAVSLDTRSFKGQRGEYQIEAYSVDQKGKEILLAKSAVTFPQYVPFLMYHAIDEYKGEGLKILFVTPANFEKQMMYLKEHGYTPLTFEHFADINKVNKPIFITFDDGMKNNMNTLPIFTKVADDQFKPVATEFVIAGRIDSGPYSLSSADIKEMEGSGFFSIQSHTMTHSDLRSVTNYEQELNASKEKIEQLTGKPVMALAYPIGYFNDKVVEETKKYYKYAVTTKSGEFVENGQPNELYLIHRLFIKGTTTMVEFARLLP
ncbi:polysaccharide deacetylase family protein [Bacillus sp. BRMEA1]|uniref:polysaccharide deacetylase family protein n=1 Tax=Neobacillus endophyticus TaxID=2738405 RepID=UPI00156335E6|nr:polysaccharide deacetylase family protein [Neobacillus endophyticus]NRD78935.1 polysaccharide deacetylase family protein [Neobacillus endophyticus]